MKSFWPAFVQLRKLGVIFAKFFFAKFLFLAITTKHYNNTEKTVTYNLHITYSPNATYTTTIKINTNKPNITYYKHVHVTVITNTRILCYGERKNTET